ncbi:MAG: hypothetical protein AAB833_00255 [Patescibacteria group bacterium]
MTLIFFADLIASGFFELNLGANLLTLGANLLAVGRLLLLDFLLKEVTALAEFILGPGLENLGLFKPDLFKPDLFKLDFLKTVLVFPNFALVLRCFLIIN